MHRIRQIAAIDLDGRESRTSIKGEFVDGHWTMGSDNHISLANELELKMKAQQAANQKPVVSIPSSNGRTIGPAAIELESVKQARRNTYIYEPGVAEGQRKGEAIYPFHYGGPGFGTGMNRCLVEGVKQAPGVVLPEMAVAKLVQLYKEYRLFKYYKEAIKTLDVATDANQAVFYSGPGNRALAMEFAGQNGKKTIDMTTGGQWLNEQNLYDVLPREMADAIWKDLSKRFADGASGQVVGFVKGARPDRVFETVEYKALLENKKVTNVITGGN